MFLIAMPLKDNSIFFEETSLVARPAMSFQDCKDRCYKRLKHLGITVTKVHEEEFCYIPMGGALPAKDQRIIGLGGAAAMVHPSTGYHLCRCMMGASDMAAIIIKELKASSKPNLDQVSAMSYNALWAPDNIRQRNFAVFGGEYLMNQDVVGLRGFFDGFFRLPIELWAGFLAGWPGLPNNDKHESWYARLWFGLSFVARLPLPVAWSMFTSIVMYSITKGVPLPQSVTPFLGQPQAYVAEPNMDYVGDVAAKEEAFRMLSDSDVEGIIPVAFVDKDEENVQASVDKEEEEKAFEENENTAFRRDEDEEEEDVLIEIA
jgi:lycopene beta-cyclase